MDLLDKLLEHDSWTTRQLIEICLTLTDDRLDQEFDLGHRSVRKTLDHIIWNIECWTDLLREVDVRTHSQERSMQSLSHRFDAAIGEFHTTAHQIANEDRLNEFYLDFLDKPPRKKSFGGTILHVVTHNMHHRAHLLYFLRRLGIENLPEGDVLTWEQSMRDAEE